MFLVLIGLEQCALNSNNWSLSRTVFFYVSTERCILHLMRMTLKVRLFWCIFLRCAATFESIISAFYIGKKIDTA